MSRKVTDIIYELLMYGSTLYPTEEVKASYREDVVNFLTEHYYLRWSKKDGQIHIHNREGLKTEWEYENILKERGLI